MAAGDGECPSDNDRIGACLTPKAVANLRRSLTEQVEYALEAWKRCGPKGKK